MTLLAPRLHAIDLAIVEATTALRATIFASLCTLGHQEEELEGDAF